MLEWQAHHPHHGASNRAGSGAPTKAVIQRTTDDKRDYFCYLVTKTCLLGGQEYETLGLGGWASSLQ